MTVIKRDKQSSSRDLVGAINEFVVLLKDEGEEDAVSDLKQAASRIEKSAPGDASHKEAIASIIDAFEDKHELSAYILERPDPSSWTIAEQLSQAGSRVLSLARRLR